MGFGQPESSTASIQDVETGEHQPVQVYTWTSIERNRFLIIVSLLTFLGPLTSSLLMPALNTITEQFDAKTFEITLAISITLIPMSVLTVFWGPLSERVGRRPIYLFISLSMCILFYLVSVSWNIWILILVRFFMGIPMAALFVLGYGVISDTFPPQQKAKASV